MNETSKIALPQAEFDKKIDIEAQNLMYFDRMSEAKALVAARTYIESKYQVS